MTTRKDVNDRLTRTNIKGRDYIDVAQRVQGFWELYPEGRINTEMTADDGKRCVFRAEAYATKDSALPIATGHAYEVNNGRGVNATSYIENCVPLDTQILTDKGWRYYYQVKPGDNAWSLNMETGENEFCKVIAVNVHEGRPLTRLSNSRFDFACTDQHKWITREQGKGLGKTATSDLKSHQKIVTAVKQSVNASTIGRMLGWLMCDAEIARTEDGMPSTAYISQAKHVDDVAELFGSGRKVQKRPDVWKDCFEWVVPAQTVRDVLGRFGIASYSDLPAAMASAKVEDVAGCYRSMMLADGEQRGFSSTHRDLVDAVQIMCARLGLATNRITSRMCKLSTKPIYTLAIKSTDGAWFSEMNVEGLPPRDVWCPTTENGTWCARQNGFVSMTSNCETSAVGRALGMLGIGSTDSIASADEVSAAMAQKPAQRPSKPRQQPSKQKQACKRLKAACKAYEAAHPQEGKPEGWALEGVGKRGDIPPKDAPDEVRAAWFEAVAEEFERAA